MTLTPHSRLARRSLLLGGCLAALSSPLVVAACSEPTCNEMLTCTDELGTVDGGDEQSNDAQAPLHDGSSEAPEPDAAPDVGDAGDADAEDAATLGPRIVAISPAPGAKGVRADANLVVTFDRPMDKTKTAQAYVSSDLPATAATLTWNTQGTQLTVNPTADLAYASGLVTTTPEAIAARGYSFRITTAARDAGGNALPRDVTSSFTTLRRLAQGVVARRDAVAGVGHNEGFSLCATENRGDTSANLAVFDKYKQLVTFDLSLFPKGIVSFEAASVSAKQIEVTPITYTTGVVIIDHVREPVPLREPHTAFDSTPIRSLGVFSSNANLESKSVSALDAVRDDYSAQRQYTQYRIDNTFQPSGHDIAYAQFDCFNEGFRLAAVYLVP